MSSLADETGELARLVEALQKPTDDERRTAKGVLFAIRTIGEPALASSSGWSAAMQLGSRAVRSVRTGRVAVVVTAEVTASAIAAPWLMSDVDRVDAIAVGLRVAARLMSDGDENPGRDTGTWGAVAGAIGIEPSGTVARRVAGGSLAASLALAAVPSAADDLEYVSLRAGHAAASAVLAIVLADAGFFGDPLALETLRERLSTPARSEATAGDQWLAMEGLQLLERLRA